MRIVVLGYIIRGPLGGLVWHHLQYLLGFDALGHEVYYFEDSDDYPSCYDPARHITSTDPTYGLQFASATFNAFCMGDRWAYYDAHGGKWHGPLADTALIIAAHADVVLNLSGVNPLRSWLAQVSRRVFVDTDPTFTQIRHLQDPSARARARQHSDFFTFGENIASVASQVPDDGFAWRATRQPVYLPQWPVIPPAKEGRFTTVMQWDSYTERDYNGVHYGMKSASFNRFLGLPRKTAAALELAIGSSNAPRKVLTENGWYLRDPLEVTRNAQSYQDYIQRSRAEFSVAKHGYVVSNSGWFSERSAVYLASGRPTVVQDTGFRTWLDTDRGVLSFASESEALAAIDEVNCNYKRHQPVAREICAAYFDYRRVLTRLLEQIR